MINLDRTRMNLIFSLLCPLFVLFLKVCVTHIIYSANTENYKDMASIAKTSSCSLAVYGNSIDEVSELTTKIKDLGVYWYKFSDLLNLSSSV